RELVIGRRLAGRNTNRMLKRIQIFAGSTHMTRRAVANAHQIPPAPSEMKLCVKRRHAMDAAQRHARLFGNEMNRLFWQIAVNILRPLEDGNERAFLAFELFENASEAGEINQ